MRELISTQTNKNVQAGNEWSNILPKSASRHARNSIDKKLKKAYDVIFLSLFIFRGHSTREPASSRVTYFILLAYTGTMCQPQPTQEKLGNILEKMQVNGPDGCKKEMYVWLYTDLRQALWGERLSSCVLSRWDFNVCVRSFSTAGSV